jgi:TRAP-type C4-dicarboxylate transport system permease large subunit
MIAIGVPIAVALAGSSMLYIALAGTVPEIAVIHRMVNGVDSFPLLAIPFFIMAGNLMNTAGITERIYEFAKACVGWLHGGLGHVNVAGSVIFAGMSGTAVADAGGLGTDRDQGDARPWLRDEIRRRAHGGLLHHRPHHPAVAASRHLRRGRVRLYRAAFCGGIVPGLVMAAFLMVTVTFYAWWRGYPRDAAFRLSVLWRTAKRAVLPLMTPAIIIGGMTFGLFTPTEAAIAACAYALLLGVVYRSLNWRQLLRVSFDTIETTAVVLFIVAGASIFGWVLTTTRTTEAFAAGILALTEDPVMILIIINLLLLVVGCFMETIAAITILTPVLLPITATIGMDPVHFGIMMVLNLMIGLLTPPVGMVLYVLARVASISFEDAVRAVAPFLIPLILVLILVTFVPWVTLWLPTLLYR